MFIMAVVTKVLSHIHLAVVIKALGHFIMAVVTKDLGHVHYGCCDEGPWPCSLWLL